MLLISPRSYFYVLNLEKVELESNAIAIDKKKLKSVDILTPKYSSKEVGYLKMIYLGDGSRILLCNTKGEFEIWINKL